jgi:hypothetical protein
LHQSRELTTLIEWCGKPGMIVSDHGTELTGHARQVSGSLSAVMH